MDNRILLIDGMNMFIRSFAAIGLANENGNHIGGIYGVIQSVKSICETFRPTKVIFCWEGKGAAKKRREILAEYKAGRDTRRSLNKTFQWKYPEQEQESFRAQLFRIKEYLEVMPIYQVEVDQLEADDIIAYVSNKCWPNDEKVIISSDRDYFQLITEKVNVYRPIKRELITLQHMHEFYKIFPPNWIIVKTLTGDGSDGVAGVKGLGIKTINKLLPFLNEPRRVELSEIFEFAQQNVSKSKQFKNIVDSKEQLQKGWEVMQLLEHNFSLAGMDTLTTALDQKPTFKPFQLRLLFMQDHAFKQITYFDSWNEIFTPLNYRES